MLGGSLQEPKCLSPRCRKSKPRRSRGPAAVPLSPRWIVNVECVEEGGRVISEAHSGAIEPASTHSPRPFPQAGRPLLRSVSLRLWAVPLSAQEVMCVWTVSVQASGYGGATCQRCSLSSVAAFSSNRKNIQGTGNLLLLTDLAELRLPEQPLSPLLCSRPGSDRRRNSPVPCSLWESALCLCTVSTLQYLPTLSLVLSFLFSTFKLITAGLLHSQWNTITKKLARVKRKKNIIRNQQTRTSLYGDFY